jgi:hypothetical protein
VYSGLSRCIGIVESTTEGLALVRVGLNVRTYHVKQCRRLVRRERRKVWVMEGSDGDLRYGTWDTAKRPGELHSDCGRWVEFVEARKERK